MLKIIFSILSGCAVLILTSCNAPSAEVSAQSADIESISSIEKDKQNQPDNAEEELQNKDLKFYRKGNYNSCNDDVKLATATYSEVGSGRPIQYFEDHPYIKKQFVRKHQGLDIYKLILADGSIAVVAVTPDNDEILQSYIAEPSDELSQCQQSNKRDNGMIIYSMLKPGMTIQDMQDLGWPSPVFDDDFSDGMKAYFYPGPDNGKISLLMNDGKLYSMHFYPGKLELEDK